MGGKSFQEHKMQYSNTWQKLWMFAKPKVLFTKLSRMGVPPSLIEENGR